MTIQQYQTAELTLSKINPRQEVSDEYIDALAASIAEIGLIQPIAGLVTDKGVEIVAGGCRLRALKKLASEQAGFGIIDVKTTEDPDTAALWSAAENEVRRQLRPAAMIKSCRNMRARGEDVTMISRVMGVEEKEIYRCLALAALPDDVITALDAEDISFDQAKALTSAQSNEALEEAFDLAKKGYSSWQVREALVGEIRLDDWRVEFVGIEAVEEAGGTVITDLFEERSYINGITDLDGMVKDKLAQREKECVDLGYAWTTLFAQRGGEWELLSPYVILNKSAPKKHRDIVGRVGWFDYSGNYSERDAVTKKDSKAAHDAGLIDDHQLSRSKSASSVDPDQPKPDFSQKLAQDLKQTQLLSVMDVLRENPELALDLLAFQLSGEGGNWLGLFAISTETTNRLPSVESGLEINDQTTASKPFSTGPKNEVAALTRFLKKGREARNEVLADQLCKSLSYSCGMKMLDKVGSLAEAPMRAAWTPDTENFFSRVSGPYLERLYTDLLSLKDGDDRLKTFRGLKKKADKSEHLEKLFASSSMDESLKITAKQRAKIDAWTPDLSAY